MKRTKTETYWHVVAKGSFKYGTVFTLRNFTSLSHSMTDAPKNLRMWR